VVQNIFGLLINYYLNYF